MKQTIENRQEYNREILKRFAELVEKYPEIRFNQFLDWLNLNDNSSRAYNEEPWVTLAKIEKEITHWII